MIRAFAQSVMASVSALISALGVLLAAKAAGEDSRLVAGAGFWSLGADNWLAVSGKAASNGGFKVFTFIGKK